MAAPIISSITGIAVAINNIIATEILKFGDRLYTTQENKTEWNKFAKSYKTFAEGIVHYDSAIKLAISSESFLNDIEKNELKLLLTSLENITIDTESKLMDLKSRLDEETTTAGASSTTTTPDNQHSSQKGRVKGLLGKFKNAVIAPATTHAQRDEKTINKLKESLEKAETKLKEGMQLIKDKFGIFKIYFKEFYRGCNIYLDYDNGDHKDASHEAKLKHTLLNPPSISSSSRHSSVPRKIRVEGQGGMGKTTILKDICTQKGMRENFRDGIHFMTIGEGADDEEVKKQICKCLGNAGFSKMAEKMKNDENIEDIASKASKIFRERRLLLVVDDWHPEHVKYLKNFENMLCESMNGVLLVSSRYQQIGTRYESVVFKELEPTGLISKNILLKQIGYDNLHGTGDSGLWEAIDKILNVCGGIKLCLAIAGSTILLQRDRNNRGCDNEGIKRYAKDLRRTCDQLLGKKGEDYMQTFLSVLETSLEYCDEDIEYMTWMNLKGEKTNCRKARELFRGFCVFEKQRKIPIDAISRLWDIERDCATDINRVLTYCSISSMEDGEYVEIHDKVLDVARILAEKDGKESVREWHDRILRGYNIPLLKRGDIRGEGVIGWLREGEHKKWMSRNDGEDIDGEYLMRNICRHLYHGGCDENEVVTLVTRPEWIQCQVSKNGLLQYERDVGYGIESIERRREDGSIGTEVVEMIRDATRLSASYICKNSSEVWFQLYGRLMRSGNIFESTRKYLRYVEENADRPWLRPIEESDGLLTSVGSGRGGLIDVGNGIFSMVVLPGEEEAVCGCGNGELVIVSLKENVVKKRWVAHEYCINDMAIGHSGKYVASVSDDKFVKIWETGSWHLVKTLKHSREITFITISRDEKRIFTGSRDGSAWTWDVESGECIYVLRMNDWLVRLKLVLRNGKEGTFSGRHWKHLRILKIENQNVTGQECRHEDSNEHHITTEVDLHCKMMCIAMNKDESRIITGHDDGSLQLWDAKSMTPINDPWAAPTRIVNCVAFSRDSTKVVSGYYNGTIQVRDVRTGELVCASFKGHLEQVNRVHFIEEDNRIVSCSSDKTVRLWKTDESVFEVPNDEVERYAMCLRCSADESCFVTGHRDGRLCVWDAASGQLIRQSAEIHDGCISGIAVRSDGQWIISVGDGKVQVSDWETLDVVYTLEGHKDAVTAVEISKNQEFAVTVSYDKTIRIWDLIKCDGSHQIIKSRDWGRIDRCFISDDDKRIVASARHEDGKYFFEVWDIEAGRLMRKVQHREYFCSRVVREDIMILVGESQAGALNSEMKVIIQPRTNEIRYGSVSNSVVLGTLESDVWSYEHSKTHQVVAAILEKSKLRFIKLEV